MPTPPDAEPPPAWYEQAAENSKHKQAEQQAQYARNYGSVRGGFGRAIDGKSGSGWESRLEGSFISPSSDGAGGLFVLLGGFSFWYRDSQNLGAELPAVGFGGGYRTPFVIAYGGILFGAGREKETELGYVFGAFANAGFDFGPVALLADVRAEERFYGAGGSRYHLSYGGVLSVDFE